MKNKQEFDKVLKQMKDALKIQKDCIGEEEYMLGMYNGMEFVISCMEKREPKYEEIKKKETKIRR
jgi:hypothetical protein